MSHSEPHIRGYHRRNFRTGWSPGGTFLPILGRIRIANGRGEAGIPAAALLRVAFAGADDGDVQQRADLPPNVGHVS